MITTYDLRDSGPQQVLADELRALGFAVELGAGQSPDVLMRVTHEVDEVGRLDAHVYAAAPLADIVTTSLSTPPRPAEAGRHRSDETIGRHRTDIA